VVADLIGPQPADGRLPLVVTPNVDQIVRFSRPENSALLAAARRARYALPDGQPIVWSSRLAGRPLSQRLTGSTLFPLLWNQLIREGAPTVLVAPSDDVAEGLRAEHPAAVTIVPPFFETTDEHTLKGVVEDCVTEVRGVGARHLFVGIGFPKQEKVALGVLQAFEDLDEKAPVVLLVGAALSMHLGLERRAPAWVQRLGVEFLFRFVQEPRRLFRRYFVTDLAFLPIMVREVCAARRSGAVGQVGSNTTSTQ
jgi:N-acetylglucosaminyldiphosphoundecaprenol N-acetyl-beta-D-mannosaminyltransferase